MATIRKREGANAVSFQVRYNQNGREFCKTFRSTGITKTEIKEAEKRAKQFAKDIEASLQLGMQQYNSNVTFKEYAEEFIKFHSVGKKPLTVANYKSIYPILFEYFGEIKVTDINAVLLDRYFYELKKQGLAMATIKKRRDLLSLVFKSAKKKKIIKENPLQDIDFVFEESKKDRNKKLVDPTEFQTVYNAWQVDYYKDFMMITLFSGMREGEACALTWDDVDFSNLVLTVNKAVNKYLKVDDPKSYSSFREIPIHRLLLHTLIKRRELVETNQEKLGKSYKKHNLVICKPDGDYINPERLSQAFWEKNRTYGTYVTPHMLRHTFTTLINNQNVNIKDLQALLGHSSANVTLNVYAHHTTMSDDTLQKLDSAFSSFLDDDGQITDKESQVIQFPSYKRTNKKQKAE